MRSLPALARSRPSLHVAMVIAAAAAGCAPSLATLQPAHVAPAHHAQVTVGMEIGVPTGTVVDVVDAGRTAAKAAQTQMIDDRQKGQLIDAGVAFSASPVAVGQHFAIAYTVVDRVEVGLRYAGGGFRLGARYQVLRHESDAMDMTVGIGVSRATTAVPLGDVLPVLKIEDFTRWTIDLPLLVGTSRSWFRVWAGPKVALSRFDTALRAELFGMDPALVTFEGHGYYFGGQGGFALGYKPVFVGFELTLAELVGSATIDATPVGLGSRTTDIGGFVVYPSFGILGEF